MGRSNVFSLERIVKTYHVKVSVVQMDGTRAMLVTINSSDV